MGCSQVTAGAKPVAPGPGGGGADRGHCCRKTAHPSRKRELGGEGGDRAGPALNRRCAPVAMRPPRWGPPSPMPVPKPRGNAQGG